MERGIRPTAVRLLVLKAMLDFTSAFNLADLEQTLETIDKSTLYRTIKLFQDKLLIHSIDDGSGSVKYSVCRSGCSCRPEDLHVHFYCEHCGLTYCLENIAIPDIQLPAGFKTDGVNFVLKGVCSTCNKTAT